MTALKIEQVSASYGSTRVLDKVDLHVEEGEMVAILGPSGCGKTTLLRTIAGLHRIDTGTIEIDGALAATAGGTSVGPERRRIGLMPQEGALFPHLSVQRNIEFGLRTRALRDRYGTRAARRSRAQELAELVGLPDALDARPSELSGGQQQRVALARALAPNPAVVLMDEPFAALDAGLRSSIRTEVRDLLRANKTASVLVTHDQQEALTTADRISILLGGRCVQTATPLEIYQRPSSRAVAEFVGDAYFVDASPVSASSVSTVFGTVTVAGTTHNTTCSVMIRPEYVTVTASPDGDFTVLEARFTGPTTRLTLSHNPSGTTVDASVQAPDGFGIGRQVTATIDRPVALVLRDHSGS